MDSYNGETIKRIKEFLNEFDKHCGTCHIKKVIDL